MSLYAANKPSRDWLEAEGMSAVSNASANNSTGNNTTNETVIIPYQISQTFRPIHEIDPALIIQAHELPQPDKQGLINGIPAEIYYAMDYFCCRTAEGILILRIGHRSSVYSR